ncbi:GNAT family N-acetyltransferase [Paenibacillus sabinae]|uniref:GNAT family acetyltransferase n=1 Tax=Paenibacillus sabinae T27 TaxID=1268072 RepID=X4ZZF6_9BACL|nr:GNAT family N-acetyltransferase [Paenibacillus sabinae]AHV97039.1 GNAT family acetyltransferase [Paenibacillus sabinae T27]
MNCEELSFAEIGEEHLAEATDIYNYYVLNTTVSFHTKQLTIQEMRRNMLTDDPRFKSYAVMQDEEMQGYVLIARHKSKQAYDVTGEISVYLKPECTGKKFGRPALAFIERMAAEQGFHTLVATVCSENGPSRSFFESSGYEQSAYYREIGRKFGRWLDIVVYQKRVGA